MPRIFISTALIGATILVIFFGFNFLKHKNQETSTSLNPKNNSLVNEFKDTFNKTRINWEFTGDSWKVNSTPPPCPDPLILETPIDISNVSSVLYPGQTRGGDYKPHGGFRFDNLNSNKVTVRAPMDAQVFRASRYLVEGEIQYTFDFIAPCGIMYRFGHLLELDAKYSKIADALPTALELDSRSTDVNPPVDTTRGEIVATAVGLTKGKINSFLDFGVYDLRTKNQASQDEAWTKQHSPELAHYALCWFDLLPSSDSVKVRNLPPADSQSGASSDYCN